jgi:GT2 family glycosyltransferase
MDERPFVYIVVVNWNGWQHTVRCLDSLRGLDYPNFRVIVVDNGSTDGSAERIRVAHPDIELVEAGKNLGFGGGANIGIHKTLDRGAEYVWVLNNDIEVEPATLASLVSVARSRPGIGIVGAAVWRLAVDTEPSMHTEAFRWRGEYRLPSACPEANSADAAVGHPVDDVAGSSTLLDAAMLRQIGPFEERFFHYWDDVELCTRARRAGWSVEHACQARLWHVVGATVPTDSPGAQYYFVRNWLLFSRWAGRGSLFTMLRRAPRMTLGRIFGRRWLLKGRWRMAVAGVLGVIDALRGRYGQRDLPRWLGFERLAREHLAREVGR